MREFSFRLEKELETGLRRDYRAKKNHVGLIDCMGLKPIKDLGLTPYESIVCPFSSATLTTAGVTISFPFPQLFRGKSVTLLCTATKVFEVDESSWSLTQLTIYDAYDEAKTKNITSGGVWHFMDFGASWFLFNGNCSVFKTNRRGLFDVTDKVYVQDTMTVQTGCAHRGRAITAGFSGNFWSEDWKSYWGNKLLDLPKRFSDNISMDSNVVMWSTIGGGDTLFWLFFDYAMSGALESDDAHSLETKQFLMDILRRNEWGFMPMPWQGTIECVKSLGNNVAIYGSGGIDVLVQVAEPFPTFGLRHISDMQIADRGAVGGDEGRHIFLDNSGTLWSLSADLRLQQLGYKEFMSTMTDGDIIITHNPQDDEYSVSSDTKCYILTSAGLGGCNQLITSQSYNEGELIGVYDDSVVDIEGRLRTDEFDMGLRSVKQITAVEVGFRGDTTLSVGVYSKFNKGGSYIFSGYIPANLEGVAYPLASGVDFELAIKGANYTKTNVSYIVVRYKVSDKRSIRGYYASQDAS